MSYSKDRKLIDGCLLGSRDALEGLVRRFSDLVYRSIQCALRMKDIQYSREDLEDLHNSVFLSLFDNQCRKLRQYRGKNGCSLATWIRVITVRVVIDYTRKTSVDAIGVHKRKVPDEILGSFKSEDCDPLDNIEKARQRRLIRENMKNLAPRDRLFLTFHFEEGLSIHEIADLMDISRENAHSIKHRAIKRLKANILLGSKQPVTGVAGSEMDFNLKTRGLK